MEGKRFLGHYLIWVILLLGQLQVCRTCIEKERKALLELKKYFISRSSESVYEERTGESSLDFVLPSWKNDTKSDCCGWKGVECNRTSGSVIGISVGEMYFEEQSLLNLSLLHPFEELRSLNLSHGRDGNAFSFIGFFDDVEGYKSLRKFKYLETLDLSSNGFNNSIFPFLNVVTSLTTLNLQDNFIKAISLKELINLEVLDLSQNYFNGSIGELTHLKKLKALDLSFSDFSSSMELQDLKNLTNLEVLGLANNYLDGPIPTEVFCEMKNLQELDLTRNNFVGQIPHCLGGLNKLQVIDLSSNLLSGNLPDSFSSLESLQYLSLLDNNFTSLLSLNPLTNLIKLKVLKLSSTSDKVKVETESNWHPQSQLSVVVLRFCSLEKIPSFLLYQKNLRLVDLSNNRLSRDIPTWLLANNPELKVLQLQNNAFTIFQLPAIVHHLQVLDLSENYLGGRFPDNIGTALPKMVEMNVSNNGFQGEIPSSIGEMKNMTFLDLSYNNFSGKLPRCFFTGCLSLRYLRLSHNKLIGHFLPRGSSGFTYLRLLRIDSNLFTGKIGVGLLSSTKLVFLDMSNNSLTGAIPSWISKLSHLSFLSLSENFLEGTIPPSLVDLQHSLLILDLSGNLLSGALPSHMAVEYLLLHNNKFTGLIPDTLLKGVRILSLLNNNLSGSIPQFLISHDISILLLRGNNLTGTIPRQLCDLSNIRVLDLSNNKLNGFIPSCLSNLSFGVRGDDHHSFIYGVNYSLKRFKLEFLKFTFLVEELMLEDHTSKDIEINIAVKQRYDSYRSGGVFSRVGILDYIYAMDLSNNELSGVIPAELGDLPKIKAMNLSHNFLSSSIPSSFSNLMAIESLDLSYNMLHGGIPNQLNNLTFLQVFDVSHNNLSGLIPQGRQFNTFNEYSYLGNPLLCGLPTHIRCEAQKSSEEANNESAIDMLVFYYSSASVYVTALICIVVLMCFDCPWHRAWIRIIDAFIASARNMLS